MATTDNWRSPEEQKRQEEADKWIREELAKRKAAGITGSEATRAADSAAALIEANKAAKIKAARDGYNASLGALDSEASKVPGYYAGIKNDAAAQSGLQKANFNEYAAATGLNSGAGGQAELARSSMLGSALASADRSMVEKQSDIGLQKTQLSSNLSSTLADIESGYSADKMNQMNADKTREAQEKARALELSRLEKSDYASGVGAYSQNFQQEIDNVKNDGDTSNDWMIPILQNARNQKIAGMQDAAAKAQQQDFENSLALYKAQNSGSGGTTDKGFSETYNDLYKNVSALYGMSVNPVTGALTPAGQQKVINYINTFGGASAPQLMAAFGLSPSGGGSPSGDYNSVKRQVTNMYNMSAMTGNIDFQTITDYLDNSGLSNGDIMRIMTELGLA